MDFRPCPTYLFDPTTRHVVILAHQDDEVMYCGLLNRLGPQVRFIWVTNGDGLAPMAGADPGEYAQMRKQETDGVLGILGRPLSARICLDYSEIENYTRFIDLTRKPERIPEIMDYFRVMADDVCDEIRAFRPDVVWTSAFQNGHPEHDLVHILAATAIRHLSEEEGVPVSFYHLPEYEYTILIPMRFHPRYAGIVHRIELTEEEVFLKRRALEAYPSQADLFRQFQKVLRFLGTAGRAVGRGFNLDDFLRTEEFGPVPPGINYTRSTHWFEWANYMGDRHEGVKVRFDHHIARIAADLAG